MPATNLLDAFNNFYYQEPPLFQAKAPVGRNREFWVDRQGNPFQDLKGQILGSTHPTKFLFAGHRGSGKSTELNRLMAEKEIDRRFLLVHFSAKDTLDLADATYTDLLVATASTIIVRAADSRLAFGQSLAKRIEGWQGRITERLKQDDESWGAAAELGLKAFFGRFLLRLKRESRTRTVVRQVVEAQVSELLQMLVDLVTEVNIGLAGKSRELLVIVEDLAKIVEFPKAQELFQRSGPYFSELPFKAVFTVPLALHYHPVLNEIVGAFGTSFFLPNVRLWEQDDAERSLRDKDQNPGFQTLKKFVEKRMALSLVEDDALEEAIRMSGGLMRELAWIVHDACNKARVRGLERISLDVVLATVAHLRDQYERQLGDERWEVLERVWETRTQGGSELSLQLLHSRHILEFRNAQRWCDVHPVLLSALGRWRRLRKS